VYSSSAYLHGTFLAGLCALFCIPSTGVYILIVTTLLTYLAMLARSVSLFASPTPYLGVHVYLSRRIWFGAKLFHGIYAFVGGFFTLTLEDG
jgi:hypothetical protein